MLSALPEITEKQIASVYYSLALTSSDLNDHEAAIEYYKKELEYRKEPREVFFVICRAVVVETWILRKQT